MGGHWTKDVTDYAETINAFLLRVPPSATSVCQPADVAWMRPLKERLRACWMQDMAALVEAKQPGVPFKMLAPNRCIISSWIKRAWGGLSRDIIANGYMKCGLHLDRADVCAKELIDELARLNVLDEGVGDIDSDHNFDHDVADE